mmetsp:Transcript_13572/g.28666  ORF Transcript_13572/g.28666 Transcript_13572/m.28666 type:complete len:251 (+) Transcript_13572:442-1194(+)
MNTAKGKVLAFRRGHRQHRRRRRIGHAVGASVLATGTAVARGHGFPKGGGTRGGGRRSLVEVVVVLVVVTALDEVGFSVVRVLLDFVAAGHGEAEDDRGGRRGVVVALAAVRGNRVPGGVVGTDDLAAGLRGVLEERIGGVVVHHGHHRYAAHVCHGQAAHHTARDVVDGPDGVSRSVHRFVVRSNRHVFEGSHHATHLHRLVVGRRFVAAVVVVLFGRSRRVVGVVVGSHGSGRLEHHFLGVAVTRMLV